MPVPTGPLPPYLQAGPGRTVGPRLQRPLRAEPVAPGLGRVGRSHVYPILRNGGAGGTSRQYDDVKAGPGFDMWLGGIDYRHWWEAIDSSLDPDGAGANGYNGIAYGTSPDGTTITAQGRIVTPLAAPSWENSEICPNDVFWDAANSRWVMLYHGGNNSPADGRRIGLMFSPDLDGGGTWTRYGANPVLGPGSAGAWDDGWVSDCKVIRSADGIPRVFDGRIAMTYIGRAAGTTDTGKVGLAWSSDGGLTWVNDPANPILTVTAAAWDQTEIMACSLLHEGGLFRGWYVGRNSGANANGLGYVSGESLTALVKGGANPVFTNNDPHAVSDAVFVYRDAERARIRHGTYDFTVSPAIRGQAGMFERQGSVYFNGTSGRVDVSDEADFDFDRTSPFTLAAWIYLDRVNSGAIIAKQQNGGGFPGYNLGLQFGGEIAVDLRAASGGGSFQRRGNTALTAGVWRHVCGTYDGSNTLAGIKLYLDGAAEAMTDLDTNLTASILNNVELQVGARGGSGAPTFWFPGGRIAQAMVWSDDLTASEVATLAKGGPIPRTDALLLWLPLDDPNDLTLDRASL